MDRQTEQELDTFLKTWDDSPNREAFRQLKKHLAQLEGVILHFLPRPGITSSLRARHTSQKRKNLFVMIDVIEDGTRWLSICFYTEMIKDPEERGDLVPGGLLGEDAICFDLDQPDEASVLYLKKRLDEACHQAARS